MKVNNTQGSLHPVSPEKEKEQKAKFQQRSLKKVPSKEDLSRMAEFIKKNQKHPTPIQTKMIKVVKYPQTFLGTIKGKTLKWLVRIIVKFPFLSIAKRYHKIMESVQKEGGETVHTTSQCKGKLLEKIYAGNRSTSGICWGFCMHWIDHKAKDEDFLKRLNNSQNKPDTEVVRSIEGLHYLLHSDAVNEGDWYKLHNLSVKEEETYRWKKECSESVRPQFIGILADRILDTQGEESMLKNIGIYGDKQSGSGHALAARVSASGIDFFDPNLGEFHFSNASDFKRWFVGTFWENSYGAGKKPLNQRFTLQSIVVSGNSTPR